jgi:dipeptidyl aminopeptidase/acylaminoacyl peptidase
VTPVLFAVLLALPLAAQADQARPDAGDLRLRPLDVFGLEYASDPQISPDGDRIAYARIFMDVMKDRRRSNLWLVGHDGRDHRPLTTGNRNDSSPRWSRDGGRLAYASSIDGSSQIYVRWLDTGQEAKLTQLPRPPQGLSWSPDGEWIAFSMLVPEPRKPFAELPPKPKGAEWAAPATVVRKLQYRADGAGYLEDGYAQLFVLPAEGGTPRQVTSGPFHHRGAPSWTPDGKSLVFAANRRDDWESDPRDTEIHEVSLADGAIRTLTDRDGPDRSPVVSPDGTRIAYVGYDDRLQGYQVSRLYVMRRDGSRVRVLTEALDRSVRSPVWRADGLAVFVLYDDLGRTKLAEVSLREEQEPATLADDVGGESLGRPYASGSFSVARNGRFAYTRTDPHAPADVAVGGTGIGETRRLTRLNRDLLEHKELGAVEELWCESSRDGRRIQGWICKPPGFDPAARYPMILEIHGGPFANYGARFAAEIQLYAAAGYVVLYANPRGSTSYGGAFGNAIHHAYPGDDYEDLMSAVDAVIAKGYVDERQLFVTGGSGGGVLTSWIVGKTDRFRAAVVAKPVINWTSFVLTSDGASYHRYWFPGPPWEHPEHYWSCSPLSLVGNVTTPTMLLNGEADYRTPIAEAEQFYRALRLRGVDTVLVRIPGASHGIAARPSNLIAKVAHVLKWFEIHGGARSGG